MKRFLVISACALPFGVSAQSFKSEDVRFFEEKVRPLLETHCFKCHGGLDSRGKPKIRSGLQLISRRGVLKGGDHGPAFNEKEPGKSLILKAISYEDEDLKMPERGKLPDEAIEVITDWVERGLPWTKEDMDFLHEVHEENTEITEVNATTRAFWSYRALRRPAVPRIAGPWGKHPVDAFLASELAKQGLVPNGPASRRELIRRATYGVTGLPPTLAEVEAFENDRSPDAWEKVVDRLLASPHYGEKWARHWLDVVRYAESNGFERDSDKPHIWRYRDYVIDAFNADIPYSQFLLEQLAGDEIDEPTMQSMIATGYHRLMQWDDEPADRLQHLFDNLDDDVRITAEGMLGMTIGCARCHDHKGDPLSQEDYYSFMAFFRGVKQPGKGNANIEKVGGGEGDAAYREALKKFEEAGAQMVADLAEAERQLQVQLIKAYPALRGRLGEKKEKKFRPIIPDARSKKPAFWYYTTEKPSDGWSAVGFRAENEGWKQGLAGFGRKGTPGLEARTEWHTPELWAQTTFLLERIPKSLRIALLHDEAVEVYLNGQLVLERNGHRGDYELIDADEKFLQFLQTGRNVITAHVRQTTGGQSFDLGLSQASSDSYTLEEALKLARKGVDQKLVAKRRELQNQIRNREKNRPKPGGIEAQVVQEGGKNPPAAARAHPRKRQRALRPGGHHPHPGDLGRGRAHRHAPGPRAEHERTPSRPRELDDPARQSAHLPRDDEPDLAAPLRARHLQHPERLRLPRGAPDPPRAPRLARHRVREAGVEHEEDAQDHHDERGPTRCPRAGRRTASPRIPPTPTGGASTCGGSPRRSCAIRSSP